MSELTKIRKNWEPLQNNVNGAHSVALLKLSADNALVLDETGLLLIQIRPHCEFDGYQGNESKTSDKLIRDVFKKGDVYFNSGDLFSMDKDYFVYFADRIGDTFRWVNRDTIKLCDEMHQTSNDCETVFLVWWRIGDDIACLVHFITQQSREKGDKFVGRVVRAGMPCPCLPIRLMPFSFLYTLSLVGRTILDTEQWAPASRQPKTEYTVSRHPITDHKCLWTWSIRAEFCRWKGENVSTIEVANVIGEIDWTHDVSVYGVQVPGNFFFIRDENVRIYFSQTPLSHPIQTYLPIKRFL